MAGVLARSWVARVSLVYWASRILSIGFMMLFAVQQGPTPYTAGSPDYVTFANFWDAHWFAYIASNGYPTTLPLDSSGYVTQNAWAFLPLYPAVVGGIATILHLQWWTVSIVVSLLSGWAFMLVLYRLMRAHLNAEQSTWAVVFASVAPVSPLFGTGYAEPLGLLLLAVALLMLTQRRYGMLALLLPLLAFTRPGAIAFALTILIHGWLRWRERRRTTFPRRQRVAVALLAVWAGVLGVAWVVVAGVATGVPNAYLLTELSWRAAYIGQTELAPGTAWFQAGKWWLGPMWGVVVPLLAVAALVVLLFLRPTRRLGTDLRAWVASYGLYLFLVFFPQSSTLRILAPMFPLAGVLAQIRSASVKILIAGLFILGQLWWLYTSWIVIGSDWTPP
ncbi:MAG: hypothetical protein ACKOXM_07075 [Agromyces sp.]